MKEATAERGDLTYQDSGGCRSSSGTPSPCKHRIAEVESKLITSLRRKAHFQFCVPIKSERSVAFVPGHAAEIQLSLCVSRWRLEMRQPRLPGKRRNLCSIN